jgi:hypothetical protein
MLQSMSNETETFALIDNTTLAAAGRAMYRELPGSEGNFHAQDYYSRFPDLIEEEKKSLAELITAVVLFDHLRWDGASFVQDNAQMDVAVGGTDGWINKHLNALWVYSWFPIFETARRQGILDVFAEGRAEMQLAASQRLAINLVAKKVVFDEIPVGFRVPQSYGPTHRDYWTFQELNKKSDLPLDPQHLPIAIFLARGLYYYAWAFGTRGCAYLPHRFRSSLISQPAAAVGSLLCGTFDQFDQVKEPSEILMEIGERIRSVAKEYSFSTRTQGLDAKIMVGQAFLNEFGHTDFALRQALEFRLSMPGKNLRALFRQLVARAAAGHKKGFDILIRNLETEMRAIAKNYFGGKIKDETSDKQYLKLLPSPADKFIEPVLELLPISWQERLIKLRHPVWNETGMQIIFSYYLAPQGEEVSINTIFS